MRHSVDWNTSRHRDDRGALADLDRSFEKGDLTFETLERLNETEANFLFRKKVIHAPLPAIPSQRNNSS